VKSDFDYSFDYSISITYIKVAVNTLRTFFYYNVDIKEKALIKQLTTEMDVLTIACGGGSPVFSSDDSLVCIRLSSINF